MFNSSLPQAILKPDPCVKDLSHLLTHTTDALWEKGERGLTNSVCSLTATNLTFRDSLIFDAFSHETRSK